MKLNIEKTRQGMIRFNRYTPHLQHTLDGVNLSNEDRHAAILLLAQADEVLEKAIVEKDFTDAAWKKARDLVLEARHIVLGY